MNSEENQIFLSFIEKQFNKNNEVYFEDNSLHFWGEESHTIILTSNGKYVNFNIKNPNNPTNTNPNQPPNRVAEVSIAFEECMPLLNCLYKAYLKSNQNLSNHNKEFIKETLQEVKTYLKTLDISDSTDLSFSSIISIPNKFEDHILRVGRMLNGSNKKSEVSMLGFTNIPLTLYKDVEKNYEQINLIIPYWEIEQYPCLQRFISVPEQTNTLNELLQSFKNNKSNLYNNLFHHIIDSKIENKNLDIVKKKKL